MIRYAYLHGFASSPKARKGTALAARFAERGLNLLRPDLNQPSFETLSYSAMVAHVVERMASEPDARWRFIGSSLGGYIAARVAELHPAAVDRLLLLCPGFDMMTRWPEMMGEDAFVLWKRNGAFFFPDAEGEPRPVSWGLIDDAKTHPARPSVHCPTVVIHGVNDEVVPIETSRRWALDHPNVTLHEVDDGHELVASIDTISQVALDFLLDR